jgi:hypothetical protein
MKESLNKGENMNYKESNDDILEFTDSQTAKDASKILKKSNISNKQVNFKVFLDNKNDKSVAIRILKQQGMKGLESYKERLASFS